MRIFQSFLNSLQLWIITKWKPSFIFNIAKFKYHFIFGYKLLLSGTKGLDHVMINYNAIDIFRITFGSVVGVLSYWSMAVMFKFQSIQDLKNLIIKKL